MSTTPTALTPEQERTLQLFKDYNQALLPARLAFTDETSVSQVLILLAVELRKRGLPETVPNMIKVTNEILFDGILPWIPGFEPEKLKAAKQNEAVRNKNDAQKDADVFAGKVRAGEKKDADAKEHAALVKQCEEIIAGYNPTKNGKYDGREREEMQALWIKELHKAKEKSVEYMRSFTKGLAAARAKRYRDREKASERL
jgi:hypothetical protein